MILVMERLIGWKVCGLFLCNSVFRAESKCPVVSVSAEQPLIREQ